MLRNRKPPSAANALTAIAVAPENGALRKKRSSISGSRRPARRARASVSAAAESANRPTVWAESQPASGASMIA